MEEEVVKLFYTFHRYLLSNQISRILSLIFFKLFKNGCYGSRLLLDVSKIVFNIAAKLSRVFFL